MKESRTAKSLKNIKVSLLFFIGNLVTTFFARKIFIDHLGPELLGLNTTVVNLLNFLNLAELGIGSAIAFTLYTPLYEQDTEKVNDIVSVEGYLYRKVAYLVIGASILFMGFFPFIFAKAQVEQWLPYITFIVMLFSALLGYFVNYRQIVFTADQKEYKNKIVFQSVTQLKIILQILAVIFLPQGYLFWLLLELIASVCIAWLLNRSIKRSYPWLRPDIQKGKRLKEKYSIILVKTKQLFFHKIAGFVLNQTTPIVIYSYLSLTVVAIYGNYQLIIMGITSLSVAIFNSIGASIGNLVAEGNKLKIITIFWEIFSSRFWIASILCFAFYILSTPFMKLWLGEKYVISDISLLLMVCIAFISLVRHTVENYLGAYGLFQDIYAPIIEAILNISLSVWLGYCWGLPGILSGVLISLILVVMFWKPLFLYLRGFQESPYHYFIVLFKYIFIAILPALFLFHIFPPLNEITIKNLAVYAFENIILYSAIYTVFFYMVSSGLRAFFKRLERVLLHRQKR